VLGVGGGEAILHNVSEYAKSCLCFQHKLLASDDCILTVLAFNFKKRGLGLVKEKKVNNFLNSRLFLVFCLGRKIILWKDSTSSMSAGKETAMEYDKTRIGNVVRDILLQSSTEAEARRGILIVHGQYLQQGISFVGQP
jgi:hypothetical protein